MLVEGNMQYLFDDETGKRYLDAFAGSSPSASATATRTVVEARSKAQDRHAPAHATTIYLHPTHRPVRREAREQDAGYVRTSANRSTSPTSPTPAARRTRSPSSRPASSPGNHDVIALRNGYHGGTTTHHGPHRPRHVEVQVRQPHGHSSTQPPRLLLPLPVRSRIPILRTQVRPRTSRSVIAYQTCGQVACLHRRADPGRRRRGGRRPRNTSRSFTTSCESTAASVSPTRCRGASGAPVSHYWSHQHFGVQPDFDRHGQGHWQRRAARGR